MTLMQRYIKKEKTFWFRTGYIYSFRYKNYENDPTPTIIVINAISGKHPVTGHKHNYLQGINFSYIPRGRRKWFINKWRTVMEKYNGNVRFTWPFIVRKYPWMIIAIRRYLLGMNYIKKPIHIKYEFLDKYVEQKIIRDYSQQAILNTIKKNHKLAEIFRVDYPSRKFGGIL